MTTISIQNFINNFGGGLRPNRFKVIGSIPTTATSSTNDERLTYLVRATALPSSDLSVVPVAYRGRSFKIPGNRSYVPWQIVILDDKKANQTDSLWKKFHAWSNLLNSHISNLTSNTNAAQNKNFANYMRDFTVEHLDINGICEKKIKLVSCWPSAIGAIDFNMGDNESYTTFPVTLEYQYYTRESC